MIKIHSASVKFKFTCPNIFARYGIQYIFIVVADNRSFDSYEIRDLASRTSKFKPKVLTIPKPIG